MAKRIKITQPGWEGFTGEFGMVVFADGVSEDLVSPRQFNVIAATIAVEEVDEAGEHVGLPGIQDNMKGAAVIGAPVLTELPRATDEDAKAEAKRDAAQAKAPAPVDPLAVVYHTKADLEAVAEKKGIHGLREIAEPHGVKGRSINELVKEILKAEAKLKAQADALNAGTETVRETESPTPPENPDEIVEEGGDESEKGTEETRTPEEIAAAADAKLQSEPNSEIAG
jgi:hypothetical protein